eukprot:s95_g2.t1
MPQKLKVEDVMKRKLAKGTPEVSLPQPESPRKVSLRSKRFFTEPAPWFRADQALDEVHSDAESVTSDYRGDGAELLEAQDSTDASASSMALPAQQSSSRSGSETMTLSPTAGGQACVAWPPFELWRKEVLGAHEGDVWMQDLQKQLLRRLSLDCPDLPEESSAGLPKDLPEESSAGLPKDLPEESSVAGSPKDLPEGNSVAVPEEPGELEGEGGEVAPTSPKQHHILDELLTRAKEDLALGKVPGKGRKPKKNADEPGGRGRGRNKGEGKGRGRGARAAKSKASKPAVCRKLPLEDVDPSEQFSLTKEPEIWKNSDEEIPISNPEGEASAARPEAKAKAKAKATKAEDGEPKRRGRKPRVESAASAPDPKPEPKRRSAPKVPKKRSSPKVKPAPKKSEKEETTNKGRKGSKKVGDEGEAPVPKPKRPNIPLFQTCTIVPYWSRDAIAIKVQSTFTKSGWTQAWFLHMDVSF